MNGLSNRSMPDSEIANRFGYHPGTKVTIPNHRLIRLRFAEMAKFLDATLPPGRAKSVALTELEDSSMWANKAIAEMSEVVEDIPEQIESD